MIVTKYDNIFTNLIFANRYIGGPLGPHSFFKNRSFDIFSMRFFEGVVFSTFCVFGFISFNI